MKLKIAISQFQVSEQISKNKSYIIKQMNSACAAKVDIIHFPETALTGYETPIAQIDWQELEDSLGEIKQQAKESALHVVLGAHQKVSVGKPFNCLYVISDEGEVIGRYFKNHLYKKESDRFQTKSNLLTKEINGVKCGFLVCYDSCFPQIFDQYRKKGVKLLFLSSYNAGSRHGKNNLDVLMKSQLITRAADNLMYISASNSSLKYSRMPTSFVKPDGSIVSLKRHKPDILFCEYPSDKLEWTYDNSAVI